MQELNVDRLSAGSLKVLHTQGRVSPSGQMNGVNDKKKYYEPGLNGF